jgi:hypothetical protein
MKFKLTEETKIKCGITFHRIEYFDGTKGGWLEKESNLSQVGNARVYGNALVFDNALVFGNAQVYDNVRVYGNAQVSGNVRVYGNAQVSGNALVFGNAQVLGNALVSSNVQVFGNARVSKTPIVITGYAFPITITETHMFIGCKGKTKEDWKKFTREDAEELGYAELYDKLFPILKYCLGGDLNG